MNVHLYNILCLQSFEEAVDKVKNLKQTPSDASLLELYAFYKQATVGDVNTGNKMIYIYSIYVNRYNSFLCFT